MFKKLRKVSTIVLIMLTLLTLFGPVAFASEISNVEISQGLLNEINKTNDFIYKEINKATEKAEREDQKNQSEQKLNQAIDKIIEELLEKTEKKVDKLIERAAKEGVVLQKYYVKVKILDRIVYVDPCYAH